MTYREAWCEAMRLNGCSEEEIAHAFKCADSLSSDAVDRTSIPVKPGKEGWLVAELRCVLICSHANGGPDAAITTRLDKALKEAIET